MRFKNLYWTLSLLVVCTSHLHVVAQVDTLSSRRVKEIKKYLDSIVKTLEDQNDFFTFFVSIDFQQQKAYGCILKKNDTSINGEKILIVGKVIDQKEINQQLLKENKELILDFFDSPGTYLNPSFADEKGEISHDNIILFAAKKNGEIIFKRYFYRSNYLASKNQKIKLFFLKLGDFAD